MRETQSHFDLSGGYAALDFVNSLDNRFHEAGPVELLTDYDDLLRFMQQTTLLDSRQARLLSKVDSDRAARAVRSAKELREALAAAFYGYVEGRPPLAADVRTLERQFHSADRHRELRWEAAARNSHPRAGITWEWGRFEANAELPVWILSQSASRLMQSDAMEWVRACGAESCRWLFLDTSKNHTRRWCNMSVCGNRMKARRFQARRR
jgi:predicted RNA-binding Zn ribbon-like protein